MHDAADQDDAAAVAQGLRASSQTRSSRRSNGNGATRDALQTTAHSAPQRTCYIDPFFAVVVVLYREVRCGDNMRCGVRRATKARPSHIHTPEPLRPQLNVRDGIWQRSRFPGLVVFVTTGT